MCFSLMVLSALRGHYLQETCLLGADVIQRDVHVVSVLAHNHGMPLTECTSSNVLSTDTDIKTCSDNSSSLKETPGIPKLQMSHFYSLLKTPDKT